MKIRNGFVSNSSSSSFIIAFPKKPSSREILYEMLQMKNKVFYDYDDKEIDNDQIVDIIFNDVKNKKNLANLNTIAEEIATRYYYSTYSYNDNGWYDKGDSIYFGKDKKLLNEIKDLYINQDELNKKYDAERLQGICDLLKFRGIKPTGVFQYSGGDVPKYPPEVYTIAVQDFDNTLMGQSINIKKQDKFREFSKKIDELSLKLGKIDAEYFINNNKGSVFYSLTYSDNDGLLNSVIEHKDVLTHLPHIRISHH